jgi:hypothetical protein
MKRILIDDSLIHPDGSKGLTWLIEPAAEDWPSVAKASSDAISLELQMQPIGGVPGLTLVEEKILSGGSTEETQRFVLAPDTAFALFRHWQEQGWGNDED